ncbi:MAG: hypothetical protein QXI07_09635 [Pyrobaculum sp.]
MLIGVAAGVQAAWTQLAKVNITAYKPQADAAMDSVFSAFTTIALAFAVAAVAAYIYFSFKSPDEEL